MSLAQKSKWPWLIQSRIQQMSQELNCSLRKPIFCCQVEQRFTDFEKQIEETMEVCSSQEFLEWLEVFI